MPRKKMADAKGSLSEGEAPVEKEFRHWRSTPELFEEALLCRRLMLRGYKTASDLVPPIGEWRVQNGLGPVTLGSVRAAQRRVRELWEEERQGAIEGESELRRQRIAELDALIVQSQEMLREAPPQSMNRANLVKEIRGAIMDKAKLEDLLSDKSKQEVVIHDGDRALREQVEALLSARGVGLDGPVGIGTLPMGGDGRRRTGGRGTRDADTGAGDVILALPSGARDREDAIGG